MAEFIIAENYLGSAGEPGVDPAFAMRKGLRSLQPRAN